MQTMGTPPLEFKKNMTSCAAVLQNTLKFSLAPQALAKNDPYFSLKGKKAQQFSLKSGRFLHGAPKTRYFFKVLVVLPPLEKFLRAPMMRTAE